MTIITIITMTIMTIIGALLLLHTGETREQKSCKETNSSEQNGVIKR